ncbi:hypothetical protein M378DRAFT_343911 [Amanita muscaria Koide BX008]|uniref:Uncharacterized protein n=1 Tax=Amanita muscaria (strain Koide BX008) TaxID=946122 RepID=A0A0C2S5R5_AMAMK|nr:hypothetical protein M378DRAFT_343911 [Amanita muscaria Koide BX008]
MEMTTLSGSVAIGTSFIITKKGLPNDAGKLNKHMVLKLQITCPTCGILFGGLGCLYGAG